MADRRLQVFYTVAKQMSFTRAADYLHMTQPAVTFQVRQLEEQLNTRLFDRTHSRISLTPAGDLVYNHAEQIFELYARMENEVRALTGEVSGVLMIGASTTVAEYMLPVLLGDFRARYPDVSIQLKVSNSDGIVNMVESNSIDLGVVEAPVNNRSLMVEECMSDRLVLIVPPGHPLVSKGIVTAEELTNYPFVCREEGSGTREVIGEWLQQGGLSPGCLNLGMELGSPEAIKGAVAAGMGVSILSRVTILKELQLGMLVEVKLSPQLERPFSFVYQKQKFRARAIEELLLFARNYCKSHQEEE
jgi:DNA-binding transcriptional LysR family regulator